MTILSKRTAVMLAASFAVLALASQGAAADDAHAAKAAPRIGHRHAYGRPYGYGPVAHPLALGRPAPGGTAEGPPLIQDCVHVFFPQCSSP